MSLDLVTLALAKKYTDDADARTDEQIARAVEDYMEEHPVEVPEPDLTGVVKSVNGIAPDENGNVEIDFDDPVETDPTVFDWAKRELFNKADLPTSTQSFVTVDGIEYYRYHAGATYGFTWYNPSPLPGAVTITARMVDQYHQDSAGQVSALVLQFADGTYYYLRPTNKEIVTYTTDASKTLSKIRGNYDLENWVLLDMSVMSIQANYNRGLPVADANATGGVLADPATEEDTQPVRIKDGKLYTAPGGGTVKTVNGVSPDANGNVTIEVGGDQVQADWNQHDPEQPDYVKNRPFYSHTEGEADYLVEPMDLQFVFGEAYPDSPIVVSPEDFAIGSVLYVVWDGTAYECTVKYHNMAMYNYIGGDGEPFSVKDIDGTGELTVVNNDSSYSGTVNFALAKSLAKTTLVQLDMKYLPVDDELSEDGNGLLKNSTIAKAMKNAGAQADWEENDETNPAYIKNKPFYQSAEGNYLVEPMTLTFEAGSATPNEDLSNFSLDPESGLFDVMWGNNQYSVSWSWNKWTDAYTWVDSGEPFIMGYSPLTVTRKDTTITQQLTFAIGQPLPQYQPMPEQYLPKLSGATDEAAGNHGIVPAPPIGGQELVLLGSGEWGVTAANAIKFIDAKNDTVSMKSIAETEGVYLLKGNFTFDFGATVQTYTYNTPTLAIVRWEDNEYNCLIIFNGKRTSPYTVYEYYKTSAFFHTVKERSFTVVTAHELTLVSSTSGSTKQFAVTVDDSGTLSVTEVT